MKGTTSPVSGQASATEAGDAFARLIEVMARLRGPGGCPWDAEQTHDSLANFLVEETQEVLDAIESRDPRALAEELGDVLLQIVFHAGIASESGAFDSKVVIERLIEKLITRHPHVFGDVVVKDSQEVTANWNRIKAGEKPVSSGDDPVF